MGELAIISAEGDTKVMWDPTNDDETEAAEAQFDRLVKKGFTAFSVKKDGEKGKKISKFDAEAGKIIMVPKMVGG